MREKALSVLKQYTKSEALIRHALAVEAVMRYFAREAGEDEEYWGAVGLLHDVDYEMYPEEHCQKAPELLERAGYDRDFIYSVISHGHGIVVEAEPKKYMEKVLFTIDELTGLIAAVAIMRPSKSVMDLGVKSVTKKFKDKRFAAGVNREVVLLGCQKLNMELNNVIEKCILGMRTVAAEIGL
ncbi:MAG: HDIG domain-containing metalloprotein [Desulfitobacteriia bacterium]|jgi:putative nucleotidyltransferase with HDIG domain